MLQARVRSVGLASLLHIRTYCRLTPLRAAEYTGIMVTVYMRAMEPSSSDVSLSAGV